MWHIWTEQGAYTILVEKPEGKQPLGSHRHRWDDNIKMDLKAVGREGKEWIHLAQSTNECQVFVNTTISVSQNVGRLSEKLLTQEQLCSMQLVSFKWLTYPPHK
jgi:hypothetical protein